MKRILITGAHGQIGSALTPVLCDRYGADNVIAAGHKNIPTQRVLQSGLHVFLDVRDRAEVDKVVKKQRINAIYHLAALLSAVAEKKPRLAWDVNINGLGNVLETARRHGCAIFFPSSIGSFGPLTPSDNTPQDTIQRPNTMYGITKVAGELLCDYYFSHFGVDTRGLRFPGLISHEAPPGGGTTDYAVDIFYSAVRGEKFTCLLRPNTRLDMMYMPDAVKAILEIMEADPATLVHRNAFNVSAMSFTPEEICAEIKKIIPDFKMCYKINPRLQAIADSWPNRMDDSAARGEWGWKPDYDLPAMTRDMIEKLTEKLV